MPTYFPIIYINSMKRIIPFVVCMVMCLINHYTIEYDSADDGGDDDDDYGDDGDDYFNSYHDEGYDDEDPSTPQYNEELMWA